ncbi:MAG: threonylcarbamoyl-AMP synthase [Bdellovibrionaceae bacterium]|nr:threonylcarbamoyl-AMP synthase [Bdellovibrio sp.]
MLSAELKLQIEEATTRLKNGEVVGFPTETVYGLAARIDSEAGIKRIFSTKERPFFDPLIVHVASIEQAKSCTSEWNEMAELLATNFWPGPLTLVLPKSKNISDLITSGLPTVGLRWPAHPVAQELIKAVGVPLAAPSANKFGRTSPTKAQHVREEFGQAVQVIDAGASEIGIESTVISIKFLNDQYQLALLRKGAVLQTKMNEVLFKTRLRFQWVEAIDKKESPGHMQHHYMPSMPFIVCRNPHLKLSELSTILNTRLAELPDLIDGVKIIKPTQAIKKIEFLKLSNDPAQAAREVYSQLRAASLRKPEALCFIQMPQHKGEMWESIFDRLYKAASLIVD